MFDILLIGNAGQLGWELERCLQPLGRVFATDYPTIDLADEAGIRRSLKQIWKRSMPDRQPGKKLTRVIINAAAYTAVDRAEAEPELAMAVNGVAPGILAEEARASDAAFIHYSTDYVFDGTKGSPYVEEDAPSPLNVYGASKLVGEEAVARVGGPYLILRTAWVYSLRGDNFVTKILRLADERETLHIVTDQVSNPTWARSLARATAQLLTLAAGGSFPVTAGADHGGKVSPIYTAVRLAEPREKPPGLLSWMDQRAGLYHLAGDGHSSRFEWAEEILKLGMRKEEKRVMKIETALMSDFSAAAKRPAFTALDCARFERTFGFRLPPWQTGLREAFQPTARQAI